MSPADARRIGTGCEQGCALPPSHTSTTAARTSPTSSWAYRPRRSGNNELGRQAEQQDVVDGDDTGCRSRLSGTSASTDHDRRWARILPTTLTAREVRSIRLLAASLSQSIDRRLVGDDTVDEVLVAAR